MELLQLTVRPTFDSLVDEDYVEGNDDTILYEQGLNSEPMSVGTEEEFLIPDGFEAVIDSPENAALLIEDSPLPEYVEKLSAGRYIYSGGGRIQRIQVKPEHT